MRTQKNEMKQEWEATNASFQGYHNLYSYSSNENSQNIPPHSNNRITLNLQICLRFLSPIQEMAPKKIN